MLTSTSHVCKHVENAHAHKSDKRKRTKSQIKIDSQMLYRAFERARANAQRVVERNAREMQIAEMLENKESFVFDMSKSASRINACSRDFADEIQHVERAQSQFRTVVNARNNDANARERIERKCSTANDVAALKHSQQYERRDNVLYATTDKRELTYFNERSRAKIVRF